VTIAGNRFQRPAGKAVAVGEAAERIHIGANVLNCRELGPEGVSDPMGRASWEGSLGLASGGADAADPADARHLAYDLPEDQPHGLCAGDGEPSGG
jgi:hypothetical protein